MKLDNVFLEEVGLANMAENQKQAFLDHAQEELEMRVGEKMSQGLTLDQLKEFEGIMNNDQTVIRNLVTKMQVDFRQDEVYKKLLAKYNVEVGTWEILGEYLSIKWIQQNRPDYKDVVAQTLAELKAEIKANQAQIA